MELKRIIARDSRSANEKAIQLYGSDILIISSQRVDQQTELIVAVDVASASVDAGAADSEQKIETQAMSHAGVNPFKADSNPSVPFAEVFQNANAQPLPLREREALPEGDFQTAQAGLMSRGMVSPQEGDSTGAVMGSPLHAGLSGGHDALPAHYEQQRNHEIVDMLRQEMAALRKEFALSRQMQPWQQTLGLSEDIQRLSMAMQEVGMPVALRSLLTDSIQGLETMDEAWPVVERLLVDAIGRPATKVPDTGVHALCGPSGAGKTSMLGRLAYAAALTHGADQQVMVSFGDQRPGAWSQIQLLASQAGAACYRAADVAMLQTLLDDLQCKTVWIDTPGTDFAAHAQQMRQAHSGVNLHAVLPVDATVTSVQKILQNPEIRWSSLMLTKVDEAAYPWPLIKGLCDQSLAVSCMAEDSKINVPAAPFDVERLVALAIKPLQALLPEISHLSASAPAAKPVRSPRAKKQLALAPEVTTKVRAVKSRAVTAKSSAKAAHG